MLKRDRLVRDALRDRFVATIRSGQSFDGLLVDADEKTFRFVDAWAIDGTKRVRVDGELFLPRADVIYLQKPGTAS